MRITRADISRWFPFSWRDFFISAAILGCAVGLCLPLQKAGTSDGFAAPIFVLTVLLISRLTNGYLFGLLASLVGVVGVNFIFTSPYWAAADGLQHHQHPDHPDQAAGPPPGRK